MAQKDAVTGRWPYVALSLMDEGITFCGGEIPRDSQGAAPLPLHRCFRLKGDLPPPKGHAWHR